MDEDVRAAFGLHVQSLRSVLPFHYKNFLCVIYLSKLHFDNFAIRGLNFASDESGFNRQFAVTSINQYAKLNLLWTAFTEKSIHGSPNGSSGIKNVVNQNNVLASNWKTYFSFLH